VSRPDCRLIDHPEILQTIFYPRRDFQPEGADDLDVFFPVAEGIRIGGRLYLADKNSPLILMFHGNGEIASDYDGFSSMYTDMGISLLVANYRGYGKSDGSPTASDLLDDAVAIYRLLPDVLSDREVEYSRLILMGRSLGSAATIEIASLMGDEVGGLIIESGFASPSRLMERLSGIPSEVKEGISGFDNLGKMDRISVPALFIHGEDDIIIPFEQGESLYQHCKSESKIFVAIPRAGHNDLFYRGEREYFDAIREFVFG